MTATVVYLYYRQYEYDDA